MSSLQPIVPVTNPPRLTRLQVGSETRRGGPLEALGGSPVGEFDRFDDALVGDRCPLVCFADRGGCPFEEEVCDIVSWDEPGAEELHWRAEVGQLGGGGLGPVDGVAECPRSRLASSTRS